MTFDNYMTVIRKLKNRYSKPYDLRIAMDVLIDVAAEDLQNGFLTKDDYYRVCIESSCILYPEKAE